MKKNILSVLLLLLVIYGCSTTDSQTSAPGTAKVTHDQAEELAKSVYGIDSIGKIESRILTESELSRLTEEQLNLTPVYYVIEGSFENQQVKVYISSNEITHHFIINTQ